MKRFWFLIPCLVALLTSAQESTRLKLAKTIPLPDVKGRFDHFAIDVKGHRLFVAALGNDTVEVVDLSAKRRMHSILGCSKPQGLWFHPKPNLLFVANGGKGQLQVFDCASYKLIKTLGALADADNLRYDVKADRIYVGYGDGALAVVNAMTAVQTGTIKLEGHPESFQLEQQGRRIFVNVPDARHVAVIDRQTRTVSEIWPLQNFQANFPMALDETNHRLFIGCRKPARLVIMDTAIGKVVADVAISGDTDDIFYDAKHKRLYISCGEGFIEVIEQRDPDIYKTLEKIPTAPGARTSFFSPELSQLYLAVPARGNQPAEIRIFEVQ